MTTEEPRELAGRLEQYADDNNHMSVVEREAYEAVLGNAAAALTELAGRWSGCATRYRGTEPTPRIAATRLAVSMTCVRAALMTPWRKAMIDHTYEALHATAMQESRELKGRIAALERELEGAREELGGTNAAHDDLDARMLEQIGRADRLAAENAELREKLSKAYDTLKSSFHAGEMTAEDLINEAQKLWDAERAKDAALSRLERAREALDKLPEGVWETWTSNSYRRISRAGGGDGDVLRAVIQNSDGHPDLSWDANQCQALCDLVNAMRQALADMEGERAPVVPDETLERLRACLRDADNRPGSESIAWAIDVPDLLRDLLAALGEDGRG